MHTIRRVEAFAGVVAGTPIEVSGKFNVLIEDGVGDVAIERSIDEGVSYHVVSQDATGAAASYTTANNVAFNGVLEEPDSGVLYRFNCTAFTSGPINASLIAR